MIEREIKLSKVRVHNLKSVSLALPHGKLIVFTGVSGSGKSSLAFDTIYAEGQRRYIESLSTFARRQLGEMAKPDLDDASGITPTISIEQKTMGKSPRSTVGTMTEIYDYLRVLFARASIPHCPISKQPVLPESKETIIRKIQHLKEGTKIIVLAPFAKGKKGEFKEDLQDLVRKGFTKARIDGSFVDIEEGISLDGNVSHDIDLVFDRLKIGPDMNSRIAESTMKALEFSKGSVIVLNPDTDEEKFFSTTAYSPESGIYYPSLEPNDFSFNSPAGMCPTCLGIGIVEEFDLDKIIDPELSIKEDCCSVASSYNTVRYGNIYDNLARIYGFDVQTPWKKLKENQKKAFLFGTEKKWTRMQFTHPVTHAKWHDYVQWRGVLFEAHERMREAKSDSYQAKMKKLIKSMVCPECEGERIKPYPRAALFKGKSIGSISRMTIGEALQFFKSIELEPGEREIAHEIVKEIIERFTFLMNVGLGYLALDRTSPTLSGGESQRVRLASQIGSGLIGITYILDEPSIGLHHRDNQRLIRTLLALKESGNTVIVVEHDEETIESADFIVDFGPDPGTKGGEIVFQGEYNDFLDCERSVTAQYLTGKRKIPIPKKRRKGKGKIVIRGASHHNLKNVNAEIPLGILTVVTGVSGSGKSSLIQDILYPALSNEINGSDLPAGQYKNITGAETLDKVIAIDQSPIGRTPRSNPATYIKVFDEIRDLFAALPESLAKGWKKGRFSFNVKEGTCHQCLGLGMVKIDMDFLEESWVDCPLCLGKRFDGETLSVLYKGKNIHDVLEMEIEEAKKHFENQPRISKKLDVLCKVGLGYIKLGQSSTTLSGGEAQRIKLAKELARPDTGSTLYIFDEPTTGLHFHDVAHLVQILEELRDKGNTVVVIEHNLDVIKCADWICDLGPEGGSLGGNVIGTGTPEEIAKLKTPTGDALSEIFRKKPGVKKKEVKERSSKMEEAQVSLIRVEGASQHNLKHLDVAIPRNSITILTGPSGSGKSSLAFDTLYAEGQRRYVESLSPYARQFVQQMPKPAVERVDGLSPSIAIEQRAHTGNPRSTVGTLTEIYDYMRILFSCIGVAFCPETKEPLVAISKEVVAEKILSFNAGEKVLVLAPVPVRKKDEFEAAISKLRQQGFVRIRLNGELKDLDSASELIAFDPKRRNELMLVIDRLKMGASAKGRVIEALEKALEINEKEIVIQREEEDIPFNMAFSSLKTGKSYPSITPKTFAFNTQEGMCPDCLGIGVLYGADLTSKEEVMEDSPVSYLRTLFSYLSSKKALEFVTSFMKEAKINTAVPIKELGVKALKTLMNGSGQAEFYTSPLGFEYRFRGINETLAKAGRSGRADIREPVMPLLDEVVCYSCGGSRINSLARNVLIAGQSIADLTDMPVDTLREFINGLNIDPVNRKLLETVLRNISLRLSFLQEVGLGFLSLNRKAPTLSGGESQRIRLARQLGSGLENVLYVLDEPTIGLHPRDIARLNSSLKKLKDLGNTLVVVEHDPETIKEADYILDFGPSAGVHGGHITARGDLKEILNDQNSLTGLYLSGKKSIEKLKPGQERGFFKVENAKKHNLKGISAKFPIGEISCITGVSGSGKSTLMHDVIAPLMQTGIGREASQSDVGSISGISSFDKVILLDQSPIGLTIRATVATYTDILTPLRDFFAKLKESRARGLSPKHFSYNHRAGMCSNCWGLGIKMIEMHFMPSVTVTCPECQGYRLNPLSLEVLYKEKNLGQYLKMTVDECSEVFDSHPKIKKLLQGLASVGLGYLKLDQEIATLSGGEAQRLKLSRELSKRSTGNTLYLFDEPTTGLHFHDIAKLMPLLGKLCQKGNTLLVIEHNMDFILHADWVVDLGPECGSGGGQVVYQGRLEGLLKYKGSYTGQHLVKYLKEKKQLAKLIK